MNVSSQFAADRDPGPYDPHGDVPELDSEAAVSAGDNCDEQSFTPRVGSTQPLENTYSNTKDMNDASPERFDVSFPS